MSVPKILPVLHIAKTNMYDRDRRTVNQRSDRGIEGRSGRNCRSLSFGPVDVNNIVQTGDHKTEDQEGQQTSGSDAYDAAPVYMIIFTATDGGQTCYMLNDHILIDNAAKKETILTEDQYVQLLQALGVVLKKEDGK